MQLFGRFVQIRISGIQLIKGSFNTLPDDKLDLVHYSPFPINKLFEFWEIPKAFKISNGKQ